MSFQPSRVSYGVDAYGDGILDYLKGKVTAAETFVSDTVASAEGYVSGKATDAGHFVASTVSGAADYASQKAAEAKAAAEAPFVAAAQTARDALDAAEEAAKTAGKVALGATVLGVAAYVYTHRTPKGRARSNPDAHAAAHVLARWMVLGGGVAGAAGVALTTAGAATLQPEVLALSAPLIAGGAVLLGVGGAVDEWAKGGSSRPR